MRETRGDQASSGGDLTRRGSDLLLYAFPRRLDDAAHLPGGGRRRQKGSEGVNRQMKASDVIRRHPTPSDAIRRHPTPSEGSRRNLRASRAQFLVERSGSIRRAPHLARRVLGGAIGVNRLEEDARVGGLGAAISRGDRGEVSGDTGRSGQIGGEIGGDRGRSEEEVRGDEDARVRGLGAASGDRGEMMGDQGGRWEIGEELTSRRAR